MKLRKLTGAVGLLAVTTVWIPSMASAALTEDEALTCGRKGVDAAGKKFVKGKLDLLNKLVTKLIKCNQIDLAADRTNCIAKAATTDLAGKIGKLETKKNATIIKKCTRKTSLVRGDMIAEPEFLS